MPAVVKALMTKENRLRASALSHAGWQVSEIMVPVTLNLALLCHWPPTETLCEQSKCKHNKSTCRKHVSMYQALYSILLYNISVNPVSDTSLQDYETISTCPKLTSRIRIQTRSACVIACSRSFLSHMDGGLGLYIELRKPAMHCLRILSIVHLFHKAVKRKYPWVSVNSSKSTASSSLLDIT